VLVLDPSSIFTSPNNAFVTAATSSSQGQLVKELPAVSVLLGIPFHRTRLSCLLRVPWHKLAFELSEGNTCSSSEDAGVTVVMIVVVVVAPPVVIVLVIVVRVPVSSLQCASIFSGIPKGKKR
jgi:hypothetical protein